MNILREIRELLAANHQIELVTRLDVLIVGLEKGVYIPFDRPIGSLRDIIWHHISSDGDLTTEEETGMVRSYMEALGLE